MISRDREDQPSWAVLLEGRVVGVVSLTFEQNHRISVIGYGIHGDLKGRGISAEASSAVLKCAFDCYPQAPLLLPVRLDQLRKVQTSHWLSPEPLVDVALTLAAYRRRS